MMISYKLILISYLNLEMTSLFNNYWCHASLFFFYDVSNYTFLKRVSISFFLILIKLYNFLMIIFMIKSVLSIAYIVIIYSLKC